jgi:hypothetical protein
MVLTKGTSHMPKAQKPIEPREFILTNGRPHTNDEIRDWILSYQFPPEWGVDMEVELVRLLTAEGFSNIWCQCLETHRVARVRMTCGAGEPRPVAEIRRVLRRVARKLGSPIPKGGLNVEVRRDRVDTAVVMEQPV